MEELNEKSSLLYQNINFYNRYKTLSEAYQTDNYLEKYDVKNVIAIINEFGYKAKFIKSGSFFQVEEVIKPYEFYYHICLKYGNVELIIGGKNLNDGSLEGDVFAAICKYIEMYNQTEIDGYIMGPKFDDYETLKIILKEAFSIYEDFKTEFMKIYV